MSQWIAYVALKPEHARRLGLPPRFLTDTPLPQYVRDAAKFVAEGHNFEQLTPTRDVLGMLPAGCCIDVNVRTESVPRVIEFPLPPTKEKP